MQRKYKGRITDGWPRDMWPAVKAEARKQDIANRLEKIWSQTYKAQKAAMSDNAAYGAYGRALTGIEMALSSLADIK